MRSADHVQGVAAAGRPTGDDADDDLGHEADQPLALEDVQASEPPCPRSDAVRGGLARVHLFVLVAGLAADPLVAAGAEGPAAVLRGRPVAGEQDAADVGAHPCVLEARVELVDGVRAERVAHLGTVERDPHRALVDGAVVGDVGQVVESRHGLPGRRVEDRRHHGLVAHAATLSVASRRVESVATPSSRPARSPGCDQPQTHHLHVGRQLAELRHPCDV